MTSIINCLNALCSSHIDRPERNESARSFSLDNFATVKKIAAVAAIAIAAAALIALGIYFISALGAKTTISTGIAKGSHLIPAPVLIDGIWFYGRPIIS